MNVPSDVLQDVQMLEDMCDIIRSGKIDNFWFEVAEKTQKVLNYLVISSESGGELKI